MTLEELVGQIQNGAGAAAIERFMAANPEVTLEQLAASAPGWRINEVTEVILKAFLAEQPDNIAARKELALLLIAQNRHGESGPHFEHLSRTEPANRQYHTGICWAHFANRNLAALRLAMTQAQKSIPAGEHMNWQSGQNPTTARVGHLADKITAGNVNRANMERQRRLSASPPASQSKSPPADRKGELAAETQAASEIGTTGAVLSAAVAADADAAEWRFEYGASPDGLTEATPWQPVPGALNARVSAAPMADPQRFKLYAGDFDLPDPPGDCLVGQWPFGQDPNHLSGVGFCELVFGYWHNSCQPDGAQVIHPWEGSDLRGGECTIEFQRDDFDTKAFRHCLGIGHGNAYWMLTGEATDLSGSDGPGPQSFTFDLSADPGRWTYFGNNPIEQPADHDRYVYGPLDGVLGGHTGNLVLMAPFGDPRETSTGSLGVREVSLTYRDRNVLSPVVGARLTAAPDGTPVDPGKLTDGRRGRMDDGWYHAGPAGGPLRFVWDLPKPCTVTTVVLHQDPAMPVKRCRVTVGVGPSAQALEFGLSEKPEILGTVPPFMARIEGGCRARRITLEILEGFEADGVGLQAIEVFASDFVPPPSPELTNVAQDIGGLDPGANVYYRAVCRAGGETSAGDVLALTLPDDETPLLHSAETVGTGPGRAVVKVRGNAMGHWTTLQWQIEDERSGEISFGREKTASDRYITLWDMIPGAHRLKVKLTSDAGESETEGLEFVVAG